MQYCSNCGAENTDPARFCGKCGAALVAAAGPAPPLPAGQQPTLALQSLLHGRYLVRKLLAQGGMGAVYLAEDRQVFDKLCVVKEMLPYYTTQEEYDQARQSFEREARLLSRLRNPGIPQIYDYFIESNRYYLAMEWVEGENLEQRLARQAGPLPESEVLDYALQLANILVYNAKQNPPIIHRDIKPANVIVGDDGLVKLVDFGIAKATTGSGLSGQISMRLGTPGYAPPEQYIGQAEPRTDVYALGATLYHLLTGRDPRVETSFPFPPVRSLAPGVSPDLEGILTQMLQIDPVLRPTAVELRARLESILAPKIPGRPQPQPFVFRSGAVATNLRELAAVCDRHWDEAIEHLYNGEFEPWVEQWDRTIAVRAASIQRRGGDRSAGLEEFIRALDYTMLMPALALDQNTFDLGTLERGEKRTFTVRVMNAGRGYLHGEIQNSVPWARISPRGFGLRVGEQTTLTVTLDTGPLPEGALAQAICQVTSNSGVDAITCKGDITWQPQIGLEPLGRLDFGAVPEGQTGPVTRTFRIRNVGGGTLTGQFASAAAWLRLDTHSFTLASGADITVTAVAEPAGLGVERAQAGVIHVTAGANAVAYPALVSVQKAWYSGRPRIQSWLVYGLLVLLGYLAAAVPLSAGLAVLLGWPRPDDPLLGVLVAALALSPVGFYALRRLVARLDEIEDYHHRGALAAELVASQFSVRKLAWLAGAGALVGGLIGWRLAPPSPDLAAGVWVLINGLIGAIAGSLLAAEGEPSPPLPTRPRWLARLWRGPSLAASPTYAVVRSLLLLLAGGWLGMLADALIVRRIRPEGAIAGALLGLLMSSESHRLLCARLRWLLGHGRLGGWIILGCYLALSALYLWRWQQPWAMPWYGYLIGRFEGLLEWLWLVLLIAAGLAGAVGGLWIAGGAGQPWARAPRLFLGLTGVLAAAGLPVYVVMAVLVNILKLHPARLWLVLLAVLAASIAMAWAMRSRPAQVQTTLARARVVLTWAGDRLQALLPVALQRGWDFLGLGPAVANLKGRVRLPALKIRVPAAATVARWRAAWASLTLAELSAEMTIPLAVGAVGVAVLIQPLLANSVIELIVGLGTVLLYTLAVIVALIVLIAVVRYVRSR